MVRFARNPEQRRACGGRARGVIQSYSIASAVEGTVNAVSCCTREDRAHDVRCFRDPSPDSSPECFLGCAAGQNHVSFPCL